MVLLGNQLIGVVARGHLAVGQEFEVRVFVQRLLDVYGGQVRACRGGILSNADW